MLSRVCDFLLVDGPPAYTKETEFARYPALHFFREYLANDYTVILDDVSRLGEQWIMDQWELKFGIKFERRADLERIAIGRPNSRFKI